MALVKAKFSEPLHESATDEKGPVSEIIFGVKNNIRIELKNKIF